MPSVTRVVRKCKQPYGGYLPIKNFGVLDLNSSVNLYEINEENIYPSIVGTAVDYLTRFGIDGNKYKAFCISLMGAECKRRNGTAIRLLSNINGVDDNSIINACKLVGYDVCYRAGNRYYKSVKTPNTKTIFNIRTMVNRSLNFFRNNGPIVEYGFDFTGAYTGQMHAGDGDYITKDTLWDMKVSGKAPDKNDTLQILCYYILGLHSIHNSEFKNLKYLGIYNPRLNKEYSIAISNIDNNVIELVTRNVVGYKQNHNECSMQNLTNNILKNIFKYLP